MHPLGAHGRLPPGPRLSWRFDQARSRNTQVFVKSIKVSLCFLGCSSPLSDEAAILDGNLG